MQPPKFFTRPMAGRQSEDKRTAEEKAADLIATVFMPLGDDPREAAANMAEGICWTRPEGAQEEAEREILRLLREQHGVEV